MDVVIERRAGAVVGVEVKAKASLQPADLRGLWAVPLATLWEM